MWPNMKIIGIMNKNNSVTPHFRMDSLQTQLLNKNYTFAIVGASNNRKKYGNKVLRDLLAAGYKAIPINPSSKTIEGQPAYQFMADYPKQFDVAVFITPPEVTTKIIKEEVRDLQIPYVWMQPGSESPESIEYCRLNGIKCVHSACIMIKRRENK